MNVTINTDASFSREHKRGSYAFWIVSDRFVIKRHGMLKGSVSRPEDAEFKTLINALHVFIKHEQSVHTTKIFINTDCLNVIHVLKKNKAAINQYNLKKWGNPLKEKFYKMLRKYKMHNIPIEFRHVRSHVEIKDSRTYVNDWCDNKAKEEIRKFIENHG